MASAVTASVGRAVVALRKESVDRNKDNADTVKAYAVALRKESVDRNCTRLPKAQPFCTRRSPQGERG